MLPYSYHLAPMNNVVQPKYKNSIVHQVKLNEGSRAIYTSQ